MLTKKLIAEFVGTCFLVMIVVGSGIMAQNLSSDQIIILLANTIATGAGLTALIWIFITISGAHFNPAVSFGLWAAGRFNPKNLFGYIVSQTLGALVAASVLFLILTGKSDFESIGTFAANGYGDLSPGGYSLSSVLISEFVLTAFFLIIILGSTTKKAYQKFAPMAIGFALTLIHLISIPISNTSVNPARSTGQAIFAGADFSAQLWLFWLAPIAGAIAAGIVSKASQNCD